MENREQKRQELREQLGVLYESRGLPPVPARIVALLTINEQCQLSFDQIREHLKVSKSATSNGINLLLNLKQIEYFTKPGDRKRYFKLRYEYRKESLSDATNYIKKHIVLLSKALELRENKECSIGEHLRESISLLDYLSQELPLLIDRWKRIYASK